MISKELLSAVLDESVTEIQSLESPSIFGSKQLWITSESHDCAINLYELAHKCKEWAYNEGYYLIEKVGSVEVYSGILMHIADSLDTPYSPNNTILACQWILDKDKR